MSEDAAEAQAALTLTIDQRADLKSFLGLSLRNGLLNIVTLTLYRFWGKTEVRRRIWSTTYVNGEPLEYLGRGVELFVGFLLALLVLGLPFLFVLFGAQLLGPLAAAGAVIPLYLALTVLLGFGRFTAFRYLASRTTWRGIRFLMRGDAVGYGVSYLAYAMFSAVTLGWFWPAAQRRLAEPLWNGLRFGDRKFRFDLDEARKEKVYSRFALLWIGGVIGYFGFAAAMLGVMASQMPADGAPPQMTLVLLVQIYAAAGVFALVLMAFYAPYHAAILRSVVRGISLEGVRLRLRVRALDMLSLTFGNVLMVALTLGFLMPVAQARTVKFILTRLETEGGFDLSQVQQAADLGPRYGEGLADAFGISPI